MSRTYDDDNDNDITKNDEHDNTLDATIATVATKKLF